MKKFADIKKVAVAGLILLFSSSVIAEESRPNSVPIYISGKFGTIVVRPKVKSATELKTKNIVKQKHDFSCGSAAVATLFKYYLNDPVTEEQVIKGLFHFGNKKKIIENRGFSLLDIKKLANALGYKVGGYKTDVEGLVTLGKPAIVTIVIGNYKHFVVFRGVHKNRVFLADPALGNTIVSVKKFEKMWYKNIALIIEPKGNRKLDKLAISDEDLVWVRSDAIRNSLFLQQIQSFKSNTEF
ncbi:C39 family peptidase [Nitrosophilus alvini]|uniref:C39 family peptidase n=1 Tax=Nitrosophilus alvini TaxID=2714855 RepID=UPI00190CC1C6|nr:C39 family peptidase [Nitrosophilus alvini]